MEKFDQVMKEPIALTLEINVIKERKNNINSNRN